MNKYLVHFIGLLSSRTTKAGMNLFFIALLARILGPSGFGEWAMIIAAGTLLHSLILNWMHAPIVRFGREELQENGGIAVTRSAQLPFLLIGFLIIFGLVILDPGKWLERYFHISGGLKLAVIFVVFWLWQSIETQNFLQIRQSMTRLAMLPVFVDMVPLAVLMIILFSGKTLPEYALITGLLALSAILWGAALWRELRQFKVRWLWPDIEVMHKIFNYACPLIPGFLIAYVSDWGDQILLRYFFTSKEVGLFQTAYQFMILLIGIAAPLGTVLIPKLIDKEISSSGATKEFLVSAGPTIITLGLFLMVPIISVAPVLFQIIMGSRLIAATPVLIILCVAVPGSIFSILYEIFFSLQNRLWHTVIYLGIMSVLNIVISLILLPRIGMLGSAIATSISYLAVQFLYLSDQCNYYRIPSIKMRILFVIIFVFGILQVVVGSGILERLMLCLLFLPALVLLARMYSLLDVNWVSRILSGKLYGLGKIVIRITARKQKGADYA